MKKTKKLQKEYNTTTENIRMIKRFILPMSYTMT